jgi:hypothetical protein
LRYIEIQRNLESRSRKAISPDTLSYHIKKLISRNYIKQSIVQGKRGKSKFYILSEITRQDIQLGLLNINYDLTPNSFLTKKGENKNAIAYFITICSIAKIDIALIVDDEKFEYGLSAKDISEYYGGLYGFGFSRINEMNIQRILTSLSDQGLLKKNIDLDNTNRYVIANDDLANYIEELTIIYNCAVFPRLVLSWKHIRYPKPYERPFFEIIYGKKNAPERINHFKDYLIINKQKDTFKEDLIIWKHRIDNYDYNIKNYIEQLSEKYSAFIERYPSIARILLEIFYPFFVREMIKDIEKKFKYKKPLKLLMVDTNSIVKSQDQVEMNMMKRQRMDNKS